MDNERLDLPSASSYHRVVACPGFLNLKAKLPPTTGPEATSEDAEIGTRIAAAMANTLQPDSLPDEEREVYERLKRQRLEIIARVFGEEAPLESVEQRLWLKDTSGNKVFSGRYDYLGTALNRGLIIDEKSGRNPVASSELNLQLRALAVLVKKEHPELEEIYCAVNHAYDYGEFTLVRYDESDLAMASLDLFDALNQANLPNAPRKPGSHCTYCQCLGRNCPEANQDALMHIDSVGLAAITETQLMPAEQIAHFLDRVKFAEDVIDAVKTEAKRRLAEDITSVPGWELRPGRKIEKVTDPTGVFNHALHAGVTEEQFMKAIAVKKGDLKDQVKIATGAKGKTLDEIVSAIFAGCVEESQSAPSLAKVKTI